MDLGLTGQVALVTAASRGIGRACAEVLAGEGMRVAITGSTKASAERASRELGQRGLDVMPLGMDLGDPASIDSAVREVLGRWGRIDALVASSPGPPSGRVVETSIASWESALQMNLISMIRLTDAVLPTMRAQGNGRLTFIGTIGVRTVQEEMVLSNATRLALMGYVKTLSAELGVEGILANCIAPGPIATERFEELIHDTAERDGISLVEARAVWLSEVPLGRSGVPEDVAVLVATLISPRCSYTTGAVIPVDGGKAKAY